MDGVDRFFEFARARHDVYLRRRSGEPWPWTSDPILRDNYFTNVYRELDKTTQWFRDSVRERLRSEPEVLLATVVFRWFNRIDLGQTIFCAPLLWQDDAQKPETIFETYLRTQDRDRLRTDIRLCHPVGPYVSGAYIIKAENGVDKLTGVCNCIHKFAIESKWRKIAEGALKLGDAHLYPMWNWLREQYYIGPFTAYEIVCDLRYTDLLCHAPDKLTWANAGPGAMRGLSRVFTKCSRCKGRGQYLMVGDLHKSSGLVPCYECDRTVPIPVKKAHAVTFMRQLLVEAHRRNWTDWEMREVEHTLCEFDKYERVRLGQGRSKRRYRWRP